MTRLAPTLFALLLALLLGAATAQNDMVYGPDFDMDNVRPYGSATHLYEPYGNEATGAIILRHSTPGDQHANFDVVGPDDFWERFDFSDDPGEEYVLDDLMPGIYSVAATDEGLELVHTLVEVRPGETVTLDFVLTTWDPAYSAGTYDAREYYGEYAGFEDRQPGYPYGAYGVGAYEAYANQELGALAIGGFVDGIDIDVIVTGPDGFSEEIESDTVLELPAGVYAIAATGDDTELSATTVEIRAGQQLTVTPSVIGVQIR